MRKGMKIEKVLEVIKINDWAIMRKDEYVRRDGVEVVELVILYNNNRCASVVVENGVVTSVMRISAWF